MLYVYRLQIWFGIISRSTNVHSGQSKISSMAVSAAESGLCLKKASKDYSIPQTTSHNHLKLKRKGGDFSRKKLGWPAVLSEIPAAELDCLKR